MKRLLLLSLLVPVALASAGDPVKSRWRSLTSGNLFEVTDYGDRLSVRFLESEVVDSQTEKPDVAVSVNGPTQQPIKPGRWLLQKREEGKYVGTRNEDFSCNYWREWYQKWETKACSFSHPVEINMTAQEITGHSEGKPASGATFDCAKCKWSKSEKYDFQWAYDAAPGVSSSAEKAPMTNGDVLKLVAGGVGEELILAKIGSGRTAFVLDTDNIIELKKAGIPDRVLAAMLAGNK